MDQNGVNYYKGVLLCSRPNESPSINKQKPFCSRVFNHQTLGLLSTKKYNQIHIQKRVLPVLSNHKKWLQGFKKKVKQQKQEEQKQKERQQAKLQKIKKQGAAQRENAKLPLAANAIAQQQKQVKKQQKPNMKKSKTNYEKPLWAQTQKQVQQNQQAQVDDVLDFFEKGQLKDYLGDEEVNKALQDLKKRIEEIKNKDDQQKRKYVKKMKEINQNDQANAQKDKDDILSRISKQSGSQSIASQKTVQRVQQLQKKKQQKDWDKYTTSQKKSMANIDDQIAKNVADQILRNYPALKHHSNQSIRKLIQQQARQVMKQQVK